MFRVHCVIVFIFCSELLRATDTLVPIEDARSLDLPAVIKLNNEGLDERQRVDVYRAILDERISKVEKKNEAVQKKIQNFYEVERELVHLGRLRVANNEHKALALKLKNKLLLTSLWVVLTAFAIVFFLLYRWRIENEKRTRQMRRAAFVAREQEKLRFSRELHDDLQSTLSIIHMLAAHEHHRDPKNHRLEELKVSSKNVMHDIRELSEDLYPREINTQGLLESLNTLIQRSNKENSSLTFYLNADAFECDKNLQLALYRSVEELVKNTLSSSDAKEVNVSLRKMTKGVELLYMENGISRSRQKRDATMLRESIQNIGGEFSEKQVSADKCDFRMFFSE